jgi:hypothetical protein
VECNEQRCTLCPDGLHSLDGGMTCQCVLGEYVQGVCVEATGCTSVIANAQGAQTCVACDPAVYQEIPVNGECVCLIGKLINDLCCDI